MGFADFLSRMVNGQPVFDANDEPGGVVAPKAADATSPAAPQSAIRKNDQASFPVVYVKHVTTHVHGRDMEIYCLIHNKWPEEVMLDKIRLLGTTHELDTYLPAGGERDFLVYKGPKLQKESYEAQLDYKTRREGDYFQAIHDVKCAYHADDKTYSVTDMRLRLPIRDIYE